MDNNIELNTIGTFNLVYSDKDAGSLRRKTGLPVSTPIELTIRHTDYVDSKTKISGRRSVVRLDRYMVIDAAGTIAPISSYVVFAVPKGSVDLTAAITSNMSVLTQLLGTQIEATTQHNKVGAIVVNGEQ